MNLITKSVAFRPAVGTSTVTMRSPRPSMLHPTSSVHLTSTHMLHRTRHPMSINPSSISTFVHYSSTSNFNGRAGASLVTRRKTRVSTALRQSPSSHFLSTSTPTTSTAQGTSALHKYIPPQLDFLLSINTQSLLAITGLLAITFTGGLYWKYRSSIANRLRLLQEESWIFGAGVTMERSTDDDDGKIATGIHNDSSVFSNIHLLELNPDFRRDCKENGWNVISLGEYLQSLRPKQQYALSFAPKQASKLVEQEIEAGLAAALLKVLGPNLGRALLPVTTVSPVQNRIRSWASKAVTGWLLSSKSQENDDSVLDTSSTIQKDDKGEIPLSLLTLLAASDLNARIHSGKTNENDNSMDSVMMAGLFNAKLSPMEKMRMGEVPVGPSFVGPATSTGTVDDRDTATVGDVKDTKDDDLSFIPLHRTFVMSRDFDTALHNMEDMLRFRYDAKMGSAAGEADSGVDLADGRTSDTQMQLARADLLERNGAISAEASDKNLQVETDDVPLMAADLYDPDDLRLPEPIEVNPRLFPGLHLGHGDALSSHTKREILKMRILSILLNRLGANYRIRSEDEGDDGNSENIFRVQMTPDDPKQITTPSEFIEALIDSGHNIQVVPTTHLTTFGVNLCVKEEDETWSHVPLGVFLESGYEDTDGRSAPAMMPHSGLDMYITGPIAGTRPDGTPSSLRLQHFNSIEGFCGWHPNSHPVVPYNVDVELEERLSGRRDVARAARIAGLYACVLNGLSTDEQLPFGGYGLTAVCNDSAALVQHCLYGKNAASSIYPMTSLGKYLLRARRYALHMADYFGQNGSMSGKASSLDAEIHDLCAIANAMKELPSDLQATPANAESAARRMLSTLQPNLPFKLSKNTKEVMESILKEEQDGRVLQRVRKQLVNERNQ